MNTETICTAGAENVKQLGRTYFSGDKLYCALSGTGAEFSFTGTRCSVTIEGDSTAADPAAESNRARVGIYVNGERVIDDMIDQPRKTYDVFESEVPQNAVISIVKLSESPMSTIAISGINAAGTTIQPTPDKKLFIEFIGDSITCGYGIDTPDENHVFSTATEDVTKAYAYRTAQALDVDYSMVSFSGYGIISGYTGSGTKIPEQTVPRFYTKLGYSFSANKGFTPSEIEWDFSKRQPDLIVVNLGTNDDSYTLSDPEKQQEYCAAYTEFLKTIRANNPDARILCTLGIMTDRLFKYVQLAVENYTAETGDTNISTMKFDVQDPADGYTADWHPSVKTHEKAFKKLTAEIKSILGL